MTLEAPGKQASKLWPGYKVVVFVIIVLSLGQLVLSNYLSTMGAQLADARSKSAKLEEDNAVLESGIVRYYSLGSVAEQGNFHSGLAQTEAKVVFGSAKTQVALK